MEKRGPIKERCTRLRNIEIDDVEENVKEVCDEEKLVVVPVVLNTQVDSDFCARWNAGAKVDGCWIPNVKFDTVARFSWMVVIIVIDPDVFIDVAENVRVRRIWTQWWLAVDN